MPQSIYTIYRPGFVETLWFPGPIAFSAFAVQLWELMIHWGDEVEYLWVGKLNFIKVLYFISRYGLLAAQVTSEILLYKMDKSLTTCFAVFAYKIILAQFTLTMVEIILLFRVYALYNQSRTVKFCLIGVFVLAFGCEVSATGQILARLKHAVDCKPPEVGKLILIQFGIGAGCCQAVVFALSLYGIILRRAPRTPLTSLMLKEGVAAFLLILGLLIVMMTHYELFRHFDHDIGNAAFSWYIVLISTGASRLILNMRRLSVKSMRNRGSPDQSRDSEELGDLSYDSDGAICLTSFYE